MLIALRLTLARLLLRGLDVDLLTKDDQLALLETGM